MIPKHLLCIIPIHRHKEEIYYLKAEAALKTKIARYERWTRMPLSVFPESTQKDFISDWTWPAWFYNDQIGFLEIGSDCGKNLIGDIFLKRKFFPVNEKRNWSHSGSVWNNQVIYYCETSRFYISEKRNRSYAKSAQSVIEEAQQILHEAKVRCTIWLPPYGFENMNLMAMERQLKSAARKVIVKDGH